MENSLSDSKDFMQCNEPFQLFQQWFNKAQKSEINDPNAMALASVDRQNFPNVRMVLLKDFDENGFVFYTNLESQKGQEILNNPQLALCFHWKTLRRQIRIRGIAKKVTQEEADLYFSSRPRNSQIGAWASKQSRPLESRFALEKAIAQNAARFITKEIKRPEYWSGFRVVPLSIEFWHDRPFRLHDRLLFERTKQTEKNWKKTYLYP